MNLIDLITVIAVIIGLVRGYMTGGIRQVLSFAGIVIALVIAVRTNESLGELISNYWGLSDVLAPIVAFAIVFFAVQLLVYGLARLLETFIKAIKLEKLNNVLGAAIGGFKAVLVLSIFLFGARYVGWPDKDRREGSLFYEKVYSILPATWNFVAGKVPRMRDMEIED